MNNRDEWILSYQNPMISRKKWQTTIDFIAKLYEAPVACLVQATSQGIQVVIRSQNRETPLTAGEKFPRGEDNFFEHTIHANQSFYVNQATHNKEWSQTDLVRDDGINSFLGIPLFWPDGSIFGALCIMDFAITHYSEMFLGLTEQFRDMIEADLLLNSQFVQLLDLSTRDDLSHLLNRQGFFLQAEKHIHLAQRLDQSVGMLAIDLNNLRGINENHGHRIGDKAIAALGATLFRVLRESDVAGRIDGDEFIVVALAQNLEGMTALSHRIHGELKNQITGDLINVPISVSIGMLIFNSTKITQIDEMVSCTSAQLQQQKHQAKQHIG